MSKFRVVKQFITGSNAYVAKLQESDTLYEYDVEQDAFDKLVELKNADNTGRKYKVIEI
jgi:hypothetical protein|tara:strand:+ start:1145 stop:1321 length:177 start_codon:yes stop_codon:yes gene_type:complete